MTTGCLLSLSLVLGLFAFGCSARVLSQCEAAKKLESRGIERTFISTYVCIMKSESGFNTSKKSGPGHKASYAYGVFQIRSDKWCSAYRKDGRCNARCDDFLDDDISDDIACAKRIADLEGFKHWQGWRKSCKNGQLPNVATCLRPKRSLPQPLPWSPAAA